MSMLIFSDIGIQNEHHAVINLLQILYDTLVDMIVCIYPGTVKPMLLPPIW